MSNESADIELVEHGSATTAPWGGAAQSRALKGRGRWRKPRLVDPADVLPTWRTLCATEPFGCQEIVFDDAAGLVAAVVSVVNESSGASAPAIDAVVQMLGPNQVDPRLAITQIIALGRVVHRGIDDRGPSIGTGPLEAALDGVINAAVVAILDAVERLGLVDPLTGVLNRRALDRDVVELIRTTRRRDHGLLVMMVDIDGLKATNDRFGHAAGDRRLCEAARSLSSGLRAGDNVYRIGGDEFVILLADLEPDELVTVVDRLARSTSTALTWGCAWGGTTDDFEDPIKLATRLLALADRRLLTCRATDSFVTIEADAIPLGGRLGSQP